MNYDLSTKPKKIQFAREAADVKRLHTARTILDHRVGQHSFNMLTLLRIIWPEAPSDLIWAIVEHDLPERLVGDIPAPTKWEGGFIDKGRMEDLETKILFALFPDAWMPNLEPDLLKWLKALDIVELYLSIRDEINAGNYGLEVMTNRIHDHISHNKHLYAKQVIEVFFQMCGDEMRHMPDL